jgi:hypothetical protein
LGGAIEDHRGRAGPRATFIAQSPQYLKADAGPAGLRGPAAPGRLSEDGRKACRSLWVEVDALLKKARDAKL